MAYLAVTVHSPSLGMDTDLRVILPEGEKKAEKVLYLLHGMGDNCTAWSRKTRIERFAEKYNYLVVMPEVQKSYYCDMKHGGKYGTYITEDLPAKVEFLFGIKPKRENTFIAGLSMGGYGALKCGLSRTDIYGGIAALSAALEVERHINSTDAERIKNHPEMQAIIGEGGAVGDWGNIYKLTEKAAELPKKERPFILTACGTEDSLYGETVRYREFLSKSVLDTTHAEWKGAHNWDFWEESLPVMFTFFEKSIKQANFDE